MPRSRSSRPIAARKVSTPPVALQNPMSSVANTSSPLVPAPTFGQTVKEGFAFGAGSALAHRFLNPFPTVQTTTPASSSIPASVSQSKKPCEAEQLAFEQCIKTQSMESYCGNEQAAYTSCIQLVQNTK